jgi:hypothetical protein
MLETKFRTHTEEQKLKTNYKIHVKNLLP